MRFPHSTTSCVARVQSAPTDGTCLVGRYRWQWLFWVPVSGTSLLQWRLLLLWQSCLFQPRSLLLLLLLLSQDPASPAARPNGGTWTRPTVDTAMSAKMMVMLLHHQCPILCPILPAANMQVPFSPLPPCRSRLMAVGATNGRRPIRYLAIPSFQRVRGLGCRARPPLQRAGARKGCSLASLGE